MNTQFTWLKRCCCWLGSWGLAATVVGQVPQLAPHNPDFVQFLQGGLKAGELQFGLVPVSVDLSHLSRQAMPPELQLPQTYAASYDLRPLGKVTPVRNQGAYGTCWAYATFGSLESCLLPAENRDFSENHLVNMDGFDLGFDAGGNSHMSMAYLLQWRGPVNESDDPYPNPYNSPAGLTVQKHVQNTRIVPGKASATGNDLIKQALLDYGALAVSYYHNNAYYNATTKSYRYTGAVSSNHAVTLVGWDDDFDKNNFAVIPSGNGAYIVKNSWGASWGESGYYYVSYYDAKFGYEPMCAFYNAEPAANHAQVYSYDPLGWVADLGAGAVTCWGANVFTASSTESLDTIGFYANSLSTGYTIFVYTGVAAGNPRSGTLAATRTGTSVYPGYRTITLGAPVALTAGQAFSIVLMLTTPGYNYPLPVEYAISGYSSAATAAAGQSYASQTGDAWTDLTSVIASANFCIKGYTAAAQRPNLKPYKPANWSDAIVISTMAGTTTDATTLLATDTLYLDFAVLNDGSAAASERYFHEIQVDGAPRVTYRTEPPQEPGVTAIAMDFNLGTLAAGTHSVRITTDSTHVIAESNEADNEYIKTIAIQAGPPEIVVEQPLGTILGDGTSTVACGASAMGGSHEAQVFTIRNAGLGSLSGLAISINGSNTADYVMNTTDMSTTLEPGACTTFGVSFNPLGTASGTRSAALHIASNDTDENPFDIALSGDAFSTTADGDGDGLNDWAEFRFAPLGFDWQVSQPALVGALFDNANSAGLFTAAQIQTLHIDTPLIARDPVTGHFTLTLGMRKSTDLKQWVDFPFTNPGTTLNGEGKVEFNFSMPDHAAFFRLESR